MDVKLLGAHHNFVFAILGDIHCIGLLLGLREQERNGLVDRHFAGLAAQNAARLHHAGKRQIRPGLAVAPGGSRCFVMNPCVPAIALKKRGKLRKILKAEVARNGLPAAGKLKNVDCLHETRGS